MFDTQNMFSDAQSITGSGSGAINSTAVAPGYIDLGAHEDQWATAIAPKLGGGGPQPYFYFILTAALSANTLIVSIQTDSVSTFDSDPQTWFTVGTFLASAEVGQEFLVPIPQVSPIFVAGTPDTPQPLRRYIRAIYTRGGTLTTGAITGGITMGHPGE